VGVMRRAFAPGHTAGLGVARACLTAVLALVFLASQSPPCDSGSAELRLPPEQRLADHADSPGPVIFRHATHVEFTDRNCLACHPAPFSLLGRHQVITHAEMEAGRACGSCHNGSDATGIDDSDACMICHSEGGSR